MSLYSIRQYTATGSPQLLAVPPYIDKSHISVTVDGVPFFAFTWTNDSTISMTATVGGDINIVRRSSPSASLVTYAAPVQTAELNVAALQHLYLVQEALDAADLTSGVLPGGFSVLATAAGSAMLGFQASGTGAVLRTVQAELQDLAVSVKRFGAAGDGVTDDFAAIILAVKEAIAVRTASGAESITVLFPDGRYVCSGSLPVVTGLVYAGASRWSASVKFTGTGAAFYSATYAAGVFTDNLDDTMGETEVNRAGIRNLYVEHTGAIAGYAPSGAAWLAAIQLVNCPHIQLMDVGHDHRTNNIHGISLKWCWRAQIIRPWVSRNGGFSGGYGILCDSQCNNVLIDQPFVFGAWWVGVATAGVNALDIVSPNVEMAAVGILMQGVAVKVTGAIYVEGNGIDIQVGTSGGSSCDRWKIEGSWHNGSSSTVGIKLGYAIRGECNDPYFTGTYSVSRFQSNATASENYGNVIEISVADAASPNLAALGLIGGRNIIRCYGEDNDDHRNYAEFRSRDGQPLERSYGAIAVSGLQVVNTRRTGWTAATGTATRSTFVTGSVTLPQLAERVKALTDDLIAHGLIGT